MSFQTARTKAEQLIDRVGIRHAPIDVEHVAASLGLPVLKQALPQDDLSGFLVAASPEAACIVVNNRQHEVRQRFTIAHEIGHFCLQHQFPPGERVHIDRGFRVILRGTRSSSGLDRKEIEANQFAASLLMPERYLRDAVQRRGTPLYDQDVAELARSFNVSEQAMTIRLQELGYI